MTATVTEAPRTSDVSMPSKSRDALVVVGIYVASIAGAVLISALLVGVTGGSASEVFSALLDGSLRNDGAWGGTLVKMAPLLIVAAGAIISARAGLVNIGQEGQLLIGAVFAAYVGARIDGPGWLRIVVTLLMAAVGGGLWAGIAAVLKFRRGVPEVLSTLLLVFVSFQVLAYGLTSKRWLLDTDPQARQQLNRGTQLPAENRLPTVEVFGNTFHIGVLLALGLALVSAFVLLRTVWGFKLRMLGQNPRTAQRMGVSAALVGSIALLLSGAFAGLAGGVLLTGTSDYRITLGYSRNYGWDGLLVALLARDKPLVAIPMAFVFACLRTGADYLGVTGVARDIVDVVQALLVLALLIPPALLFLRDRRRAMSAIRART